MKTYAAQFFFMRCHRSDSLDLCCALSLRLTIVPIDTHLVLTFANGGESER